MFISFENFVEHVVKKRSGFCSECLFAKSEKVVDFRKLNLEDYILTFPQKCAEKVNLSVNFEKLHQSKLLPKILLRIIASKNIPIWKNGRPLIITVEKQEKIVDVNTSKKINRNEHLPHGNISHSDIISDSKSTDVGALHETYRPEVICSDYQPKERLTQSMTKISDENIECERNIYITERGIDFEGRALHENEPNFHKVQDDIVEYSNAFEKSEIEERDEWFKNQILKLKDNEDIEVEEHPKKRITGLENDLIEKPMKPPKNKPILVQSRSNRAEALRRQSRNRLKAENIVNPIETKRKNVNNVWLGMHSSMPKYFIKERQKALSRIVQYKKRMDQQNSSSYYNEHNESTDKQVTNIHPSDMTLGNFDTKMFIGLNSRQKNRHIKPFVKYHNGTIRMKNLRVSKDPINSNVASTLPKIFAKVKETTKSGETPEYENSYKTKAISFALETKKSKARLVSEFDKNSQKFEPKSVSNRTYSSNIRMRRPCNIPALRMRTGTTSFAKKIQEEPNQSKNAKVLEEFTNRTDHKNKLRVVENLKSTLTTTKIKPCEVTSTSMLEKSASFEKVALPEVAVECNQITNTTAAKEFSKIKSLSFELDKKISEQKLCSDGLQKHSLQSISNPKLNSNTMQIKPCDITSAGMLQESGCFEKASLPKVTLEYNQTTNTTDFKEVSKSKSSSLVLDTRGSEQKLSSDGSQKLRLKSISNPKLFTSNTMMTSPWGNSTDSVSSKKETLPKISVKYHRSNSTINSEKNDSNELITLENSTEQCERKSCLKSPLLKIENEPLLVRSASNIEQAFKRSLSFTMTDKKRALIHMQDKCMPPKKVVKVVSKLMPTTLSRSTSFQDISIEGLTENTIDNKMDDELSTAEVETPAVPNSEYLQESQTNIKNEQLKDEQYSIFTIANNMDSSTTNDKKILKIFNESLQTKQTNSLPIVSYVQEEAKPTNIETYPAGATNCMEKAIPVLNIDINSRPLKCTPNKWLETDAEILCIDQNPIQNEEINTT